MYTDKTFQLEYTVPCPGERENVRIIRVRHLVVRGDGVIEMEINDDEGLLVTHRSGRLTLSIHPHHKLA